ncbi:sulfotransferase family 2 domain-containing protein [Ekhidna sp.]|uniref:sulfotransferase family 2 domain-containing protein n=1 Tax=Ekhidna sp. TaxID=2608089 RepID=UPI0032997596
MSEMSVVFLHIPKTGGTTINYILNDIYRWKFLWLRNDIIQQQSNFLNPIDIFNKIAKSKIKKFKAFSGHGIFPLLDILPSGYVSVLLARNPLQQIPSLYYHHLRHKSNSPSSIEARSHKTLYDFVTSESDYYPNPQIKSLFSDKLELLEDSSDAKALIEKMVIEQIDLCGITERFDDFLALVCSSLNWKVFSFKMMNQRPDNSPNLNSVIKNEILNRNKLDFFLYKTVKDKFLDLEKEYNSSSNFTTTKSITLSSKVINRIQQHRLASMANLELKKELQLKSVLLKYFTR